MIKFEYILNAMQLLIIIATTFLIIKSRRVNKQVRTAFEKIKKEPDILRVAFEEIKKEADGLQKKHKDNCEMIEIIHNRLNLLSKENVKLREENEELKERLRNLGIKDFDIIK